MKRNHMLFKLFGLAVYAIILSGCGMKVSQENYPMGCLVSLEMIKKSQDWREIDTSKGNSNKINQERKLSYSQFYSSVTGLYGSEERFIKVTNTIDYYNQVVDWSEKIDMADFDNKPMLPAEIIDVGKNAAYICSKEVGQSSSASFGCVYKTKYDYLYVNLYVWGPSKMELTDIEDFINSLLANIDSCIVTGA